MWTNTEQHTISVTESGKPIKFHYHEEGFDARDHHEAAGLHDRKRNEAAIRASRYEKLGYKGAANGYRKLAAHHGRQAELHFAKVLPAKNKAPATKPGNSTKPSPVAQGGYRPALKKADESPPSKSQGGMVGYHQPPGSDTAEAYFRTHEDATAYANSYVGHPGVSCSRPFKIRLRDGKTKEEYDGYVVTMKQWSLD